MIDEALGAARKLVGEVMKITPSVKPAELTALIGRLNDAVQAPGLADAASMRDDLYASAYVSPVERVLVEYDGHYQQDGSSGGKRRRLSFLCWGSSADSFGGTPILMLR